MVAVGLSPRNNGGERVRVAERRLNRRANREPFKRRSATPGFCSPSPWAKAHGLKFGHFGGEPVPRFDPFVGNFVGNVSNRNWA